MTGMTVPAHEAHDAARRTIRTVKDRLNNMLQDVLGEPADLDELANWLHAAASHLRTANEAAQDS